MHMSKMKINYLKSNFVFLADDSQRAEMLFNCNSGHSPITCLECHCQQEGYYWWNGNS